MWKTVFFNGPPKSGKNTAATLLWKHTNAMIYDIAQPLRMAAAALLGVSYDGLVRDKDTPIGAGITPRQIMIALSEEFAKPHLGKAFLGHRTVQVILRTHCRVILITGCGFVEELEPIIKFVKPKNCLLFRLHRQGCTFDNDSRSFLHIPDIASYDIKNDGTREELELHLVARFEAWMESAR